MEKVELGWDEFWAELFRVKHRRSLPAIKHYDEMIVNFCIEVLCLEKDDEILDIACGAGEHSVLFAKQGLQVSGFDLSKTLISFAENLAKDEDVDVNFYTSDMREIDFEHRFNAAVLLSHSFGFFNHEENKRVLKGTLDALRDEGKLLLDLMNPYRIPRFKKTWSQIDGGYLLSEPHFLDAPSGVLRGRPATFIDVENNRIVLANQDALANNDIRMYTALEIRELVEEVGFSKIDFYGQNKLPRMPYTANSERMVVVATK